MAAGKLHFTMTTTTTAKLTMRRLLLAVFILNGQFKANGFPLGIQNRLRVALSRPCWASSRAPVVQHRMSNMDYEYIPPNPSALAPFETDLKSVYPPGTPAGLRGEAVRSALRSSRCLAWDLAGSPLETGWLSVQGSGTIDFLQNKFSQSFQSTSTNVFQEACLLDAKGKVVDLVSVIQTSSEQAYLWTSPGHAGSTLYERLDPLIFPMDQIRLRDATASVRIMSIASTRMEHVRRTLKRYVEPILGTTITFPLSNSECTAVSLGGDDSTASSLLILPSVTLPSCASVGYTLIFLDMAASSGGLAKRVWNALVGDSNPEGPIELGPLEFETLRIEAGMPAFRKELTSAKTSKSSTHKKQSTPAGPLELHWQSYLDLDKGCYLGQEGVASVVKNPRGPPRLLYCVVFDDDENVYQHQSDGEMTSKSTQVENLTTLPSEGLELFVLGSNEQISVGTLTSVAEPGGTGDPSIVGLALIKRADSIMKQMKDMNIELGSSSFRETDPMGVEGSGIIQPPPLDPLDGLEVIVGGSFTVGKLRMIPSRRYRRGQSMFEDIDMYEPVDEGSTMGYLQRDPSAQVVRDEPPSGHAAVDESNTEDDIEKAMAEAAKAEAEAEAAAADAKRKAEKMEMLKRRAEEAMARRKKKKS